MLSEEKQWKEVHEGDGKECGEDGLGGEEGEETLGCKNKSIKNACIYKCVINIF